MNHELKIRLAELRDTLQQEIKNVHLAPQDSLRQQCTDNEETQDLRQARNWSNGWSNGWTKG